MVSARSLLVRGMLVGLAAGVVAYLFATVFGEPAVDQAISFESAHAAAHGAAEEPELVSRATLESWYFHDWIPIVILMAIATTYAAVQLPSLGHRAAGARSFTKWFLAPVLLVLFLLSLHRYWAWRFGDDVSLGTELLVSAAAMVVPWIVGGAFSNRWWRPWTWIAAAAAGLVGRLVASWAHRHVKGHKAYEHRHY